MTKNALRTQFKHLRESITQREQKSLSIARNVLALPEVQNAQNIACFSSLASEVNTHDIMLALLPHKKVALPRVVGDAMVFHWLNCADDLHKLIRSPLGILEPPPHFEVAQHFDVVLCPGLAFSVQGSRLGYGKGYYDRHFEQSSAFLVGLCFDEVLSQTLPQHTHDLRMHTVVTPTSILRSNHATKTP